MIDFRLIKGRMDRRKEQTEGEKTLGYRGTSLLSSRY